MPMLCSGCLCTKSKLYHQVDYCFFCAIFSSSVLYYLVCITCYSKYSLCVGLLFSQNNISKYKYSQETGPKLRLCICKIMYMYLGYINNSFFLKILKCSQISRCQLGHIDNQHKQIVTKRYVIAPRLLFQKAID